MVRRIHAFGSPEPVEAVVLLLDDSMFNITQTLVVLYHAIFRHVRTVNGTPFKDPQVNLKEFQVSGK